MKKIPLTPTTKKVLYAVLNTLPTLDVRAAMHKAQGIERKRAKILYPKEIKLILEELGLENLIIETQKPEEK